MKFIRIFLLVLIIIGIGLLLTQKFWVPKLVDFILKSEQVVVENPVTTETKGNLTCNNVPGYFVISRSQEDNVGTDILIKYKTEQNSSFDCAYVVGEKDFKIINESAEYFFAVENNFLILDSGTAPYPRGLIVYDLNTRKKVYTDSYSAPMLVSNNQITYWNPTKTVVNDSNCPKLAEYIGYGLGAGIEEFVSLDLNTLQKKNLGESRCQARQ